MMEILIGWLLNNQEMEMEMESRATKMKLQTGPYRKDQMIEEGWRFVMDYFF